MRTVSVAIALVGSFVLGFFWLKSSARPAAGPSIVYPQQLDLGNQDVGETIVHQFTIVNHGDETLIIDQLGSSCSCSGLEHMVDGHLVKPERLTIPPQSDAEVYIRLVVRGIPGDPARSVISFRTNDPKKPSGQIVVVVPHVVGISCSPGEALFSNVIAGKSDTIRINVRSRGNGQYKVISITAPSDEISLKQLQLDDVPDRMSDVIGCFEATLLPRSAGKMIGVIAVTVQGDDRTKVIQVPYSATVVNAVEISPSQINLPRASSDGPINEFVCAVHCREPGSQLMLNIKELPSGFTADISEPTERATVKYVTIRWTPPKEGNGVGSYHLKFIARVNNSDIPIELHVTYTGPR